MILEIAGICKSFTGKQVLHDVSFTVQSGRAMGFLGRNGAGKTTTFRALMDVFKADSGSFLLDGKILDHKKVKIGYMPEVRGMYAKISLLDQLVYFGTLRGMNNNAARSKALSLLERFELGKEAHAKLDTLSKGNQQKVQISQALLTDPEILVLDEPFSGLDPVNAQALKKVVKEYISADKVVIFSSHQMSQVEEFCDDITLINKGKIILSGQLDQITAERQQNRYRLRLAGQSPSQTESYLRQQGLVAAVVCEGKTVVLTLKEDSSSATLLQKLLALPEEIADFGLYRPSLEEIFISEVGEAEEEATTESAPQVEPTGKQGFFSKLHGRKK